MKPLAISLVKCMPQSESQPSEGPHGHKSWHRSNWRSLCCYWGATTSHLSAMQLNSKGHLHIAVPGFCPPQMRKATMSAGLARSAGELAKPRSISTNDSWELECKYHRSLTPEVETLWVFIVSQSPTWNSAPVAHSDNLLNNFFIASFLPYILSLTSVIGVFITYQTTCISAFVSGFASREPKLRWSSTIHL